MMKMMPMESLSRCDALPGDEQIEDGIFPNVADGLLVRDHREIVPVTLQDLVVHPQARLGCRTALVHLRHIDAVVGVTLRTLLKVLIDSSANFEATFQHLSTLFVDVLLLVQRDGNAQALHRRARLMLERHFCHFGREMTLGGAPELACKRVER